jgi:hypothetical protein
VSTDEQDWAVAIIALWGEQPALRSEFFNAADLLEWAHSAVRRLILSAEGVTGGGEQ